jgi:hypothetical protein
MAQPVPRLDTQLAADIGRAVGLAHAGELIRTAAISNPVVARELHPARLEYLYEVAYLQVFIRWEQFLEATFLRYLCGRPSRLTVPIMCPGVASITSLSRANAEILGNHDYLLWHNPWTVVNRVKKYLVGSTHETVLMSNAARINHMANIRHRVAHGQADARSKFDSATMDLAGKRYPGARPGRFLRDWNRNTAPPTRWLHLLSSELASLASQIV